MASGGKRRGAGERVLESRHVIGLFMLMLLFSGVFFTLGYVMGRNQYDGQVRAAGNTPGSPEAVAPKADASAKKRGVKAPPVDSEPPPADPSQPVNGWDFYDAGKNNPPSDNLKPAEPAVSAPPKAVSAVAKGNTPSKPSNVSQKSAGNSIIPGGGFLLQVAALRSERDALHLATALQKKKFPAFVVSPQADKYYRVQVGPYADPKAADAARKGLEDAGFKAIVKH
jgi:cell division septation protein DedD